MYMYYIGNDLVPSLKHGLAPGLILRKGFVPAHLPRSINGMDYVGIF